MGKNKKAAYSKREEEKANIQPEIKFPNPKIPSDRP